jgi:sulfate transport system ATP-binding protein
MSIELRGVSKRFGDIIAVNNVSFSVNEGELVGLLGPSGGGKTTVLRMIAGLEVPTAGDIFIRGQRVNDLRVQQRNIGFVFQNYALFKNMNVFKNIAFGLRIKKWRRADLEARVGELVRLFGLEGLERRYPHQLSGGQRQRVAIARALAPKPSVLLLDEPFGAVDAKIRQELREWLVRLQSELNVTTLFVTHDQEEAMEVSKRIVIFSRGNLEQLGTPREVYESPANEFVARFIGVMNVLELEARGGVARVNELEFPAHGLADGERLRIGFRPYAVQISPDTGQYRYRATIRQTFFLGVMLRLELELPSGLILRARVTKEEYAHLGLADDMDVSFQISEYRVLPGQSP